MKSIILLSIIFIASLIILMMVLLFVPHAAPGPAFNVYYAENLRGQLFSAFISLSGFVFALKTFIIITMKKELYDHDKYKERYDDNKKIDPSIKRYRPLNNFRILLSWTVVAALSAAIYQLTFGLIPHWIPGILGLAVVAYALSLFTASLVIMWSNLHDLLSFWEYDID